MNTIPIKIVDNTGKVKYIHCNIKDIPFLNIIRSVRTEHLRKRELGIKIKL